MIKVLNSKFKNFNKEFYNFLLKRKKKIKIKSVTVVKIINDVKKMGIKHY